MKRAQSLHGVVRHPALPALRNAFRTPRGLALVYEWVDGEVLYHPASARGESLPCTGESSTPQRSVKRCRAMTSRAHS